MISSAIIRIFGFIAYAVASVLPASAGLPTEIATAIQGLAASAAEWNYFLPLDTMYTVAILAFLVEAALLLFRMVNWTVNKIRGGGT